ncbi:MAG: hypothetical protein SP1CHLAM54_13380 [Chlamydiia bacterium]|nr:hypothetical protein [Chlamydiia bacterium]MCH9616234.1 hypothetical protein [Chlamydiia bacterium]MCH9629780.1 hypothetical protein [Chlamydiia bacterium]
MAENIQGYPVQTTPYKPRSFIRELCSHKKTIILFVISVALLSVSLTVAKSPLMAKITGVTTGLSGVGLLFVSIMNRCRPFANNTSRSPEINVKDLWAAFRAGNHHIEDATIVRLVKKHIYQNPHVYFRYEQRGEVTFQVIDELNRFAEQKQQMNPLELGIELISVQREEVAAESRAQRERRERAKQNATSQLQLWMGMHPAGSVLASTAHSGALRDAPRNQEAWVSAYRELLPTSDSLHLTAAMGRFAPPWLLDGVQTRDQSRIARTLLDQ